MPKWRPYKFSTEEAWDDDSRLHADAVHKVLMVGDVHGEIGHLAEALQRAAELQADAVVQVGDFWLADTHWRDHDPEEAAFMWAAHESPLPIVVVDGNHEVWPSLTRCWQTPEPQAAVASRRPVHLGGSLWWAWRGSAWQRAAHATQMTARCRHTRRTRAS